VKKPASTFPGPFLAVTVGPDSTETEPMVPEVVTAEVPVKRKGGRPPESSRKLTPELQERFCAAVAGAMFLGRACKLCEISTDAFESWCTKGRKGIQPYKDFVDAFEKAEVECEAFLVRLVMDAAPGDYRAALAMLKARFPTRWSDHAAKLEVFGPTGSEIRIGLGLSISITL
jgi:hypothetical protein